MKYFLESERIYLRKMTHDDFADVAEMLQDSSVMYAWEYSFTDKEVNNWIEKNLLYYQKYSLGYFLICDKSTNEVLGQAALMPDKIEDKDYYEIGYILKHGNWHKGYANESCKMLLDYAFDKLGLEEVIFEIRPENINSLRVAETLGAKVCGSFNKKVRDKIMKHLILKIGAPSK